MAIIPNVSMMMSGINSDNGKFDLNSLQFITQASAEDCEDDEKDVTGTETCYDGTTCSFTYCRAGTTDCSPSFCCPDPPSGDS